MKDRLEVKRRLFITRSGGAKSLLGNRFPDGKSLLSETESLGHLSRERVVLCLGLVEDDAATVDGDGHGLRKIEVTKHIQVGGALHVGGRQVVEV